MRRLQRWEPGLAGECCVSDAVHDSLRENLKPIFWIPLLLCVFFVPLNVNFVLYPVLALEVVEGVFKTTVGLAGQGLAIPLGMLAWGSGKESPGDCLVYMHGKILQYFGRNPFELSPWGTTHCTSLYCVDFISRHCCLAFHLLSSFAVVA